MSSLIEAQVKVEGDVACVHRAENEACLHAFVTGTCTLTICRRAESKQGNQQAVKLTATGKSFGRVLIKHSTEEESNHFGSKCAGWIHLRNKYTKQDQQRSK